MLNFPVLITCLSSGRTWFSAQGPTPVFTDSQKNGSRVMARLGEEVSMRDRHLLYGIGWGGVGDEHGFRQMEC